MIQLAVPRRGLSSRPPLGGTAPRLPRPRGEFGPLAVVREAVAPPRAVVDRLARHHEVGGVCADGCGAWPCDATVEACVGGSR
jgi:hypothetical protein